MICCQLSSFFVKFSVAKNKARLPKVTFGSFSIFFICRQKLDLLQVLSYLAQITASPSAGSEAAENTNPSACSTQPQHSYSNRDWCAFHSGRHSWRSSQLPRPRQQPTQQQEQRRSQQENLVITHGTVRELVEADSNSSPQIIIVVVRQQHKQNRKRQLQLRA